MPHPGYVLLRLLVWDLLTLLGIALPAVSAWELIRRNPACIRWRLYRIALGLLGAAWLATGFLSFFGPFSNPRENAVIFLLVTSAYLGLIVNGAMVFTQEATLGERRDLLEGLQRRLWLPLLLFGLLLSPFPLITFHGTIHFSQDDSGSHFR